MRFRPISHSWVARHPEPIGVIEFLGGAFYGSFPSIAYSHFLNSLFEAGYTVIAVPFRFGFNHLAIAQGLLQERDQIRAELNYPSTIPHLWVGHSLGCKYIVLLETMRSILDQPSLLIAPDISDTRNALPIPSLADLLDRLKLGAVPNRQETQRRILDSSLFNLTALISFRQDTIAGTLSGSPDESDVAWFAQTLSRKQKANPIQQEIPGGHREPIAVRLANWVVRPPGHQGWLEPICDRQLESLAIEMLSELTHRMQKLQSRPVEPLLS